MCVCSGTGRAEEEVLEVEGHRYVVVRFFDGCPTCTVTSKTYNDLPNEFPKVTFLEASIDQNDASIRDLNIDQLPTYVIYDNHKEVARHVGVKSEALKSFIKDSVGLC